MKYIDAEKLIVEIERKISICKKQRSDAIEVECYALADDASARMGELRVLLETITSLQQKQPDCHTVEDWMQHIQNADQLTKDIFSKGPYDVLYDALNHPYQHCYDAIKEFGELCFLTGVNSVKQEQPEVDLEKAAAAIIIKKHPIMKVASTMEMAFYEMLELVKAGYELGFNARKEV